MADDSGIDVATQLLRLDGLQYVTENLAKVDQVDHIGRISAVADNDRHQVRHTFFQGANDLFQDGIIRRKIGNKDTGILLLDCLRNLDERRCQDRIPIR